MNNETIEIQLTLSKRQNLGLQQAAEKNELTLGELSSEILSLIGLNYANLYKIGILTSAGLVARIKPQEFSNILEAAESNDDIKNLVEKIKEAELVYLDDPELFTALNVLYQNGLLESEERIAEILSF